jgi:hypothetical protein
LIIATWINDDKTLGVHLSNDGSISVMNRPSSVHIWSPPKRLALTSAHPSTHDFITTCQKQGSTNVNVDAEDRSVRGRMVDDS